MSKMVDTFAHDADSSNPQDPARQEAVSQEDAVACYLRASEANDIDALLATLAPGASPRSRWGRRWCVTPASSCAR
jgi:hypothetical protein